jgi:prepilin-type N-terminal cleavage/methylation domain-containing protein
MWRAPRSGVTLIEVVIVVVIIGLLAGMAVPKISGSRRNAFIAAMRSDLRNVVSAEEVFYSDSLRYTTRQQALSFKPSAGDLLAITTGPGYWSATATHAQVPDFTCGISVNTDNPLVAGAPEGQAACVAGRGPGARAEPP